MHLNCLIKRYTLQRNFKVQQTGTKELLFPEVTELDLLNSPQLPCDALPLRQRVLSLQEGTLMASWPCVEGVQTFLFPLLGRPFLVPLLLGDWEALSPDIPPCLFTVPD